MKSPVIWNTLLQSSACTCDGRSSGGLKPLCFANAEPAEVEAVPEFALLLKREVFEETGSFGEEYGTPKTWTSVTSSTHAGLKNHH
jgi:hypothetical protein